MLYLMAGVVYCLTDPISGWVVAARCLLRYPNDSWYKGHTVDAVAVVVFIAIIVVVVAVVAHDDIFCSGNLVLWVVINGEQE